jgi:hypothetical protein
MSLAAATAATALLLLSSTTLLTMAAMSCLSLTLSKRSATLKLLSKLSVTVAGLFRDDCVIHSPKQNLAELLTMLIIVTIRLS